MEEVKKLHNSGHWLKPALIYCIAAIVFFFLLTISNLQVDVYYLFITVFFFYVLHMETEEYVFFRKKEKEYRALLKFLSDIRHHYYVHRMVDEAVREAMDQCSEQGMKRKIEQIYEVLTAENVQEASEHYKEMESNKFLKLFLTLSLVVIEFGDKEIEGHSLLLQNIKNLKEEIQDEELLKLRAVRHRFSGLTIVAVVPAFTLKIIEGWGVENLPELKEFYHGNGGILFSIFLSLLTVFIYDMLLELKSNHEPSGYDEKVLYKVSELPYVKQFLQSYEARYPMRKKWQTTLQAEAGNPLSYGQLLLKRIIYSLCTFLVLLVISIIILKGRLPFYILLLEILLSYGTFYLPVFRLYFRKKLSQMQMEDEVLQYQAIILMLMYVDQMSIFQLLEEIEGTAQIFKLLIQECINGYHAGDKEALLLLREKAGCETFEQLVDNMLVCDEIGLIKAFDEIALERIHIREKRKQENEYNLEKKVLLGKVFGFVPMLFTVGGYLIVPFVLESYRMLSEFSMNLDI